MSDKVKYSSIARAAKEIGVSYDFLEQEIEKEVQRRTDEDREERELKKQSLPGRKSPPWRDLLIMHRIEWWRGQGHRLDPAIKKVRAEKLGQSLGFETLKDIYRKQKYPHQRGEPGVLEKLMGTAPMTDRELREFYRRRPHAIERLYERVIENLREQEEFWRRREEHHRQREEKLRRREDDARKL